MPHLEFSLLVSPAYGHGTIVAPLGTPYPFIWPSSAGPHLRHHLRSRFAASWNRDTGPPWADEAVLQPRHCHGVRAQAHIGTPPWTRLLNLTSEHAHNHVALATRRCLPMDGELAIVVATIATCCTGMFTNAHGKGLARTLCYDTHPLHGARGCMPARTRACSAH